MRTKLVLTALVAVLVTACSTTPAPAPSAAEISVSHAFVRATDATATAPFMTGAFMTITNNTDSDVTLTGATSSVAETVQVHEVVNGVMQQKPNGLTIPAGASAALQMGGNHLMLMGMRAALAAGDEVTLSLQFDSGTSVDVVAPVKSANAGAESYTATPAGTGM